MTSKPYSQACENNKEPILQVLQTIFTDPVTVWEIGSGTGQHACHFAEKLPHLNWQTTERQPQLEGIRSWLQETNLANLLAPVALDVTDSSWPCVSIPALFTANTLHIMNDKTVELFFHRLDRYLESGAKMCIYGPFNYNGKYTSDSNASFDVWLKNRDALSGIKNFEDIMALATAIDCVLVQDIAMPANNRLLVLTRCNMSHQTNPEEG
jgi:hypothetical protein